MPPNPPEPSQPPPAIAARFSAAAATYDSVSTIQRDVAVHLLGLLPDRPAPARVLDVGCGTGYLLAHAHQRWPRAGMTGIDLAPGMIAEARRQHGTHWADWLVADARDATADPRHDLVISASALHWLHPFAEGLARVARHVADRGRMAIAVMLDGTLGELHAARMAAVPAKPPRARLPTEADWTHAVRHRMPLRVIRQEVRRFTTHLPDGRAVLRAIHDMGVTSGDVSRGPAPLTRSELAAITAAYEQSRMTAQGVPVTFVVGYAVWEDGPEAGAPARASACAVATSS